MKLVKSNANWIKYSSMGLELGLSVIIGLLVGEYLDKQFDTKPLMLLLFLGFGLIAGFRSIFRLLKKLNSNSDSSSNNHNVNE